MKKKILIIVGVLLALVVCGGLFLHKTGITVEPTGEVLVRWWPGQDIGFIVYGEHAEALYCVDKETEKIVIPDTFWGKPVTAVNESFGGMFAKPVVIVLGKNVETIEEAAFSYYVNLKAVLGGENVRYIGEEAFGSCKALEVLDLGENVESIGSGAFANCKMLKSLNTSEKLAYIGSYAFYDSGIEEVYIPDTATLAEDALKFSLLEQK